MDTFDYGIIGGGPAGYTAGIMLAKQGKTVVLFEKDKLGGTCLNRGCIPTKSFLHLSELYASVMKSDIFEASLESLPLDFNKVICKKNTIIEKIRKSLEHSVKLSGVNVIYAEACINEENQIVANGELYKVNNIILATGSKPKTIKGLDFDGDFILNSDDILNIQELPKSVLIVGSGAIGIEWARILSNFGVNVTITEVAEHLIPQADIEVSKRMERLFKQRNIKVYLNDYIENIEGRTVTLKNGARFTPEKILVAAGRVPLCPKCRDDIDILGDACGEIQLAHYAIHQAKAKVLGIPFDKNLVPSVIYGNPEIAWVGVREQDMDESCKKSILPVSALGKAWCDESTDGFIKIITKNDKIIGAHIISKEASGLIHTLLIAIQNELPIAKLKTMCFAHPTYAEGIFDLILST